MATGMAIMGFGGGAFLAGYLNAYFVTLLGVAKTVMVLGGAYFIIMMIGARILRRPPQGWAPPGWTRPTKNGQMITDRSVTRAGFNISFECVATSEYPARTRWPITVQHATVHI